MKTPQNHCSRNLTIECGMTRNGNGEAKGKREKADPININGLDSNCQAYRQTMSIAQGMYPVPLTNPQGPQRTDVRKITDLYERS